MNLRQNPYPLAATHGVKGVRGHSGEPALPAIHQSPAPMTPGVSRTGPLGVHGESRLPRETDLGRLPAPSLGVNNNGNSIQWSPLEKTFLGRSGGGGHYLI